VDYADIGAGASADGDGDEFDSMYLLLPCKKAGCGRAIHFSCFQELAKFQYTSTARSALCSVHCEESNLALAQFVVPETVVYHHATYFNATEGSLKAKPLSDGRVVQRGKAVTKTEVWLVCRRVCRGGGPVQALWERDGLPFSFFLLSAL
jgi:hypothetical protein